MAHTNGLNRNLAAFLDMLAFSEGTTRYGEDDGYNVVVGGSLFDSYTDHPRQRIKINAKLYPTAAGRYQLLSRYFDAYKKQLHLIDFSPEAQDMIAIQKIKEQRVIADIQAGCFDDAVPKCSNIWASLPGAGYGQHENTLTSLKQSYSDAGGIFTHT